MELIAKEEVLSKIVKLIHKHSDDSFGDELFHGLRKDVYAINPLIFTTADGEILFIDRSYFKNVKEIRFLDEICQSE